MEIMPSVDQTSVSVEDINNIPDPSPEFRIWAWQMMSLGQLENIIKGLMTAGICNTTQESLLYLSEAGKKQDLSDLRIACCDFENETDFRLFKKLEFLLQSSQNGKKGDAFLLYGLIGHQIMPRIVSGEFFGKNGHQKKFLPQKQLKLFGQAETDFSQLHLFPRIAEALEAPVDERTTAFKANIPKIEKHWQSVSEVISKDDTWPDWCLKSHNHILELFTLLKPLFGEHVGVLKRYQGLKDSYFAITSILTWAAAITYFHKKDAKVLFTEIPVLPNSDRISGGRIDAIELRSINGELPDKKETAFLKQMAKYPFSSISRLTDDLSKVFGKRKLELVIYDWKFAVGDGINGQPIQPENIPLPDHIIQLKKYLVLASLNRHLTERQKEDELWRGFRHGQLVYLTPATAPVFHPVTMSSPQKEEIFLKEIVYKSNQAQQRAIVRTLTNNLVGHVNALLEGKQPKNGKNGNGHNGHQKHLFPGIPGNGSPIVEMINNRKYLDPETKLIEIIGRYSSGKKKDQLMLAMHFDRVITAIENGQLPTRGIRPDTGGHIRCPDPKCSDVGPSNYLSLKRRMFKCFSCGISGRLVSIPPDIEKKLPRVNFKTISGLSKKIHSETIKAVTPQEHARVMGLAQQILREQFKGSLGEEYLMERGIDPTLAFLLGAGFGNDTFINELLDSDLTLDDLIFYGFVSISPGVDVNHGLGPLLKKRGLNEDGIKRKTSVMILDKRIRDKIKGEWGYPVSVLRNRVTFPLTFDGSVTSIYGRAAYSCNAIFKHRKLFSGYTGVRHGAFNFEALQSQNKKIIVTEAAIEALSIMTLMKLDPHQAMGLIGITNELLIGSLIDSDKEILLALNNDRPKNDKPGSGQAATKRIIDLFTATNQGHRISDLTSQFLALNPRLDYDSFNDYNQLLQSAKRGMAIAIPQI